MAAWLVANKDRALFLDGANGDPRHPSLFRFQRLERAQISDDRIEIVGRDLGVPVARHCAAHWRAVRTNARADGSLDLLVAPPADAVLGLGGNVAADGLRPGVAEIG